MDDLILVDIYDQQVGCLGKEETHRLGKLHRAFSVFIYHKGCMLIQKRALSKYHSGGLWANACCSHPRIGEATLQAAHRRLLEEVGLKSKIEEVFTFVYHHKFKENLYEYEYDHVLIGAYEGEAIVENKEEVEESKWISFEDLQMDLQSNPEKYSVWFLIAAPKVLSLLKEKPLEC